MQTVQKTVLGVDVWLPQIQSILRVADIPVVQQNSVEFPQAQFLVVWEVVDMPVYVQRHVPRSSKALAQFILSDC